MQRAAGPAVGAGHTHRARSASRFRGGSALGAAVVVAGLAGSLVSPALLAPAAAQPAAAQPASAQPAAVPASAPAAAADPANDPMAHSLHLDALPNARDLGGYVTADGRTVRSGVALRSGSLHDLSDAEAAALEDMGLRTVIDLRTGYERAFEPDRLPAGAYEDWANVVGDDPANLPQLADMPRLYRGFVTDPSARAAFRHAVLDIAYGHGASLFHCTAGKDRTGWLAAILLSAIGVDRDTVYADYMASNEFIGNGMAGAAAPLLDAAGSTFVNRVERGWLDASFAAADELYGGIDGYLRVGLGLTDADVAALNNRLLE